MVGPGTGIAPLVAFAEEMAYLRGEGKEEEEGEQGVDEEEGGEGEEEREEGGWYDFHLYHGCRTSGDVLHNDRLRDWEEGGLVGRFEVALSREDWEEGKGRKRGEGGGGGKMYVQDLVKKNSEVIWELMKQNNFHYYICGEGEMANGVVKALGWVAAKEGGMEYGEIVGMLEKMKKEGRYQTDVWGATRSFEEVLVEEGGAKGWLEGVKSTTAVRRG